MSDEEANKRGYVNAEDVIGVRKPKYDEDNIRVETGKVFPCLKVRIIPYDRFEVIRRLEKGSKEMIEEGLEKLV